MLGSSFAWLAVQAPNILWVLWQSLPRLPVEVAGLVV